MAEPGNPQAMARHTAIRAAHIATTRMSAVGRESLTRPGSDLAEKRGEIA